MHAFYQLLLLIIIICFKLKIVLIIKKLCKIQSSFYYSLVILIESKLVIAINDEFDIVRAHIKKSLSILKNTPCSQIPDGVCTKIGSPSSRLSSLFLRLSLSRFLSLSLSLSHICGAIGLPKFTLLLGKIFTLSPP